MTDFIPHAAQRARERYGIVLSLTDLQDMSRRCLKGEGLLRRDDDGASHHTLIVGERVLWVVYRPPGPGRHEHGEIATVMPSSVGHKFARSGSRERFKRLNGFAKKPRGHSRPSLNRGSR